MGELKHRHLMNKHKPRKKFPEAQQILFDAGFNSGVVNKAQCEEELSTPLERFFNFKFRGLRQEVKSLSLIRSKLCHASPIKDKTLAGGR